MAPGVTRRTLDPWSLLLVPPAVFLAAFFLAPLVYVGAQSAPDFSFAYYAEILFSPVYRRVLGLTFQTAGLAVLICLLLGYPYAYAMSRARGAVLAALAVALVLPFWVSLLLRSFSWLVLLQDTGLINSALLALGIVERPLPLIRTPAGVMVGMVHILLPYMVLPLYAVMRKIDWRLMEGAAMCGAHPLRAFVRVFLPLSLPGLFAGLLLTFTVALGFYITPAMLGGPQQMMIGQLIAVQVIDQLNLGFGSALAITLLVSTAVILAALAPLLGLGARGGARS